MSNVSKYRLKKEILIMSNSKKIMDPYFAMFNNHVNNAFQHAKKIFIKRFGKEIYKKDIVPFKKNGIMSIFNKDPTPSSKWLVEMVWYFVNEKLLEK